jgi:catechol 2,3-dioxygenase-like lactoylglutathione lyase family enzyme
MVRTMLDHVGIRVRDFAASKKFYQAALKPLGYRVEMEFGGNTAGFGAQGHPYFWIGPGEPSGPTHLAFVSPDRPRVAAFYEAALAAGGRDNGPPGLRPHYHPNYYAAFIFDPDGNNVEAVCHQPSP